MALLLLRTALIAALLDGHIVMPQDCLSRAAREGAATGELSTLTIADVRQGVATCAAAPATRCDAGCGSGRRGGPAATSDRHRLASIDDMSPARIADRRKRTATLDGRSLPVSFVGARRTLEEVPTDAHPPAVGRDQPGDDHARIELCRQPSPPWRLVQASTDDTFRSSASSCPSSLPAAHLRSLAGEPTVWKRRDPSGAHGEEPGVEEFVHSSSPFGPTG